MDRCDAGTTGSEKKNNKEDTGKCRTGEEPRHPAHTSSWPVPDLNPWKPAEYYLTDLHRILATGSFRQGNPEGHQGSKAGFSQPSHCRG